MWKGLTQTSTLSPVSHGDIAAAAAFEGPDVAPKRPWRARGLTPRVETTTETPGHQQDTFVPTHRTSVIQRPSPGDNIINNRWLGGQEEGCFLNRHSYNGTTYR